MIRREDKMFGFCCSLGGGAMGFKKAASLVGNMVATFTCARRPGADSVKCAISWGRTWGRFGARAPMISEMGCSRVQRGDCCKSPAKPCEV